MADNLQRWFIIPRDLLEGEEFRRWTPGERLYYLRLMDEANLRHGKPFYVSDLRLHVELTISERTIRRGRQRAKKLGWLDFIPGRIDDRGRPVATTYKQVRWATPEAGQAYSLVSRWNFRLLLLCCREGLLTPADVLVYVALDYWRGRHRESYNKTGGFYVTKRTLRELTGLENAPAKVSRILNALEAAGAPPPFKVSDAWHQLNFMEWQRVAPPGSTEAATKFWDEVEGSIKAEVERLRQQRLRLLA